jgi:hypothetical protein
MAKFPREQVFAALYKLLQTAKFPFQIANVGQGRTMKAWDQVGSAQQPALFLHQGIEKADQGAGGDLRMALNRWIWLANVWVYFRLDNNTESATVLNQLKDAIDTVICPVPGSKQTLAAQNSNIPLVTNIRITDCMQDDGVLDPKGGQCILKVGLEILIGS